MSLPHSPAAQPSPDVEPSAEWQAAEAEDAAAARAAFFSYVLHGGTALIAPVVIVIAPVLLTLVLIPLTLIGEVLLALWHRRLKVFALRVALGFVVVVLAGLAPIKPIDRIMMEGLPTEPMTVADYNKHVKATGYRSNLVMAEDEQLVLRFSASTLSLRDFADEVEDQTGHEVLLDSCLSGATILYGAFAGSSYVLLD